MANGYNENFSIQKNTALALYEIAAALRSLATTKQKTDACSACGGQGEFQDPTAVYGRRVCYACHGSGH